MTTSIPSKDFRVRNGEKVQLQEWPTMVKPFCRSKKQYKKLSDVHERKYWEHYMKAYEVCLSATSTHHAPWYVVPADDKENARLIVSQIVLDALNELKMAYPKSTAKRRQELLAIRKRL